MYLSPNSRLEKVKKREWAKSHTYARTHTHTHTHTHTELHYLSEFRFFYNTPIDMSMGLMVVNVVRITKG